MATQLARDIARIGTTLLLKKGWHYLRYRHLREALKLIDKDATVLGLHTGSGLAEVALAMEFPRMTFTASDPAFPDAAQAAQDAAARYEVPNIRFINLDIAQAGDDVAETYGLVYSLELLNTLPDPQRAAATIRELTQNYVMTLVPIGDAPQPTAPQPSWMRAQQPQPPAALSLTQLLEYFPNPVAIRGAYWADAGLNLRNTLADLSPDDIKTQADDLKAQANNDFKDRLPVKKSQALAIWTLTLPNGV